MNEKPKKRSEKLKTESIMMGEINGEKMLELVRNEGGWLPVQNI